MERDLHVGDLRILSDFAFRNDRPPSLVVNRLCERGFLATTERGRTRMTLKGWAAVFLRQTVARGERDKLRHIRSAIRASKNESRPRF